VLAVATTLAAACDRRRDPAAPPADPTPQQLQPAAGQPAPPRVDTRELSAAQLRDAVLANCHGPVRGEMDRIQVEVTLPDQTMLQVFAQLPLRLRVQQQRLPTQVLDGEAAFTLPPDGDPTTPRAADLQRLQALRALLDAAAFGPLYRATHCDRPADDMLVLTQTDGSEWRLALRPGTLLPAELGGPAGTFRFEDWLHTPQTWMPAHVHSAVLGSCRLVFRNSNVRVSPDLFAPPGTSKPNALAPSTANHDPPRIFAPGFTPESRPIVPELIDAPATSWVVLDDPGDWPARRAAYAPCHSELVRQQQHLAGFVGFLRDGDAARMVIPFRRRTDDGGRPTGPEFVQPDGWQVRQVPATRQLLVFPSGDSYAAKVAAGTQLLTRALQQQGLQAGGPVLSQPYLDLEQLPEARKLLNPVVRMTVPVQ